MSGLINFIVDSGFVGWVIIITGFVAMALVAERVQTLYFKYNVDPEILTNKVSGLISQKKLDEALSVCVQLEDKPLAKAFKQILQKADRDDETVFQAQDIAMAETVPLYTKRLHYLSMLANVATLLGLLGTIHGLILSFQAVAQADPAQKQALLAHGISVSMYTTALGLAVAIPAMVSYSFLISKQNHLLEQLTEKCSKITELLTNSISASSFNREQMFPEIPIENLKSTSGHTKVS